MDQDGRVEQYNERRGDHEPGGPVQGRGEVVGVDEDEDPGDHEPIRRDIDRDAERAREHDPRTGVAALLLLLLLRRRASHDTDATCWVDPRARPHGHDTGSSKRATVTTGQARATLTTGQATVTTSLWQRCSRVC